MNLTPGATLQNQKYVIQKQLHQSDFGAIYQARHAYLEQDVILQTLNSSLRQRPDFDQLRQQFLQKVRSIVQAAGSAPDAPPVRVLDCFEEAGMPFVVFERTAGQVPVQLADWFPLMPHTVNAITPVPGTEPAPATAISVDTLIQTSTAPVGQPVAEAPRLSETNGVATQPVFNLPPEVEAAKPMPKLKAPARSASKLGMPLALLAFSMFGGLLGAGLGLAVRLAPTSASNSSEADETPNLPSSFLSREQSFPSDQDWPITETPQFFSTDPLPVEEPVYRGDPTAPIVPDYPVTTEGAYQPPVIPSERPAVKSVAPPSPLQSAPVAPSPVNLPPIAPENSGAVSAEPVPEVAAPSEPAPPVAAPAPPPAAPAIVEPPAPSAEPAPPAPPAPVNP